MAKFFGSRCTKDCGGHRAGWNYAAHGGTQPSNTSPSFNKGMRIEQRQAAQQHYAQQMVIKPRRRK